jgi:hypothetical protein
MPWIIAVAVAVIVALVVVSAIVHFLFSPWLLAAVAVVLLVRFWPRHSRR